MSKLWIQGQPARSQNTKPVVALAALLMAGACGLVGARADAGPRVASAPAPAARPAPAAAPAAAGRIAVSADCAKADSAKPACAMNGAPVGTGPSFVVGSVGAEIGHGFVEGTNLFVVSVNGVENSYEGCKNFCAIAALYKVDLTTGNRTILSGYYQDPRAGVKVTGAGPYWMSASSVVRGTDGALYVYTTETDNVKPHFVYRVAANGDRTEVWSSATKPCAGGPSAFHSSETIAAGPGNTLYLVGDVGSPNGAAAKLDLASGKCTVFSASGAALGSGPSTTVLRGPSVAGGKLYAVASNDVLVEIALSSGARAVVTKGSGGGIIGTGPTPGVFHTLLGSGGKVWTVGNQARKPVSVDIESGNRTEIPASAPASNAQLRPYAELPNKLMVGGYLGSVYLLDATTGKSMILSR
jgi:hypothetical protein